MESLVQSPVKFRLVAGITAGAAALAAGAAPAVAPAAAGASSAAATQATRWRLRQGLISRGASEIARSSYLDYHAVLMSPRRNINAHAPHAACIAAEGAHQCRQLVL